MQQRLRYTEYCGGVKKETAMINDKPDVTPKGRYTFKEAADKLGVSITTIYRYVANQTISCMVRANGKRIILGSEITRFWGGEYL